MMNRLHYLKQLVLLVFLLGFGTLPNLFGQCPDCPMGSVNPTADCDTMTYFLLKYCGQDTFYLDDQCEANFDSASIAPFTIPGPIAGSGTIPGPGTGSGAVPGPISGTGAISGGTLTGFDFGATGYNWGDVISSPQTVTAVFVVTDDDDPSMQDIFTFPLYFVDTIPPMFDVPLSNQTVNCDTLVYQDWYAQQEQFVVDNSSDNCGSVTVTSNWSTIAADTAGLTCGVLMSYLVFTLEDDSGNQSQDSLLLTVIDTGAPTIMGVPQDTLIDCGAVIPDPPMVIYADDCVAANDLSINPVVADTTLSGCPDIMTIRRIWQVSDGCGNITRDTQFITITDTIPPTFVVPVDTTVTCDQTPFSPSVTGEFDEMSIQDACDQMPIVDYFDEITNNDCPHNQTISRNWFVTDACGNADTMIQTITVIDTVPPTLVTMPQDTFVVCAPGTNLQDAFDIWLNNNGGLFATDDCSDISLITITKVDAGTSNPTTTLMNPDCNAGTSGTYIIHPVKFTVRDACLNDTSATASFIVIDNIQPVVTNVPNDTTVLTDLGVCTNAFEVLIPMVSENCGNDIQANSLMMTDTITYPGGDILTTPINEIVFNFPADPPPSRAFGDATLKIDLNNVDGETDTEYFIIEAEDGTVLGITNPTPVQCSDTSTTVTITEAQFNEWAYDGNIEITLRPNIVNGMPGTFSINNICNGTVDATLSFDAGMPEGLTLDVSINGSARQDIDPIAPFMANLDQGTNTITYYFADCAQNETQSSFTVTVVDEEPPVIDCPSDTTVYLGSNACQADVSIPLFSSATDNCAMTTPTEYVIERPLTFSFDPNLGDYIAEDQEFHFTNVIADATPGCVDILIEVIGNVDEVDAYFEMLDPDGNLLGNSNNVFTGFNCNPDTPSLAAFCVPADLFNSWAADGDLTIYAETFQMFPIPPDKGLNPCNPVSNNGDDDGLSKIKVTIRYESVSPIYYATGATDIGNTLLTPPLMSPTVTLDKDTTTFFYELSDLVGNMSDCSFNIVVKDTVPPVALCSPTFVSINPSGVDPDMILPSEIDFGSSDNCTIDTMYVSPNLITCDLVDSILNVTLTVIDEDGNTSTCNTFVQVESDDPVPTTLTNCGSDTLLLFANPPMTTGGSNVYQYTWKDQNGVPFAFVENPIILDAQESDIGFYTVELEGTTGCVAIGAVQVTCDNLPLAQPAMEVSVIEPCADEPIKLTTNDVCGTSVTYNWYSGAVPNGTLLATTNMPEYEIQPPHSTGTFEYYVEIERNGCISDNSLSKIVQVKAKPTALPAVSNTLPCEGESITLNATSNPGTMCFWSGPCGYTSQDCMPIPIENLTQCHSGLYTLITVVDGCESDPVSIAVNVLTQPDQPAIIFNSAPQNNPACVGDSVQLIANSVPGAVSYQWIGPSLSPISTATNELVLSSVVLADQGEWTVKAIGNPCESFPSEQVTIYVALPPQALEATVSPDIACEGDMIQLSASSSTPDVSYLWTYPDSQQVAQQNPTIGVVNLANQGTYEVLVTTTFGCTATASGELEVLGRPQVDGVSSNVPNCIDGPIDVVLFAFPVTPPNDGTYTWHWEGPNGFNFTSSDSAAVISNATIDDSGQYKVYVENGDGCRSLMGTVVVDIPEVVQTPQTPTLDTPNPHCEGDAVIFETNAFTGTLVSYLWHTPLGTFPTTGSSFEIPSLTTSHVGNYRVSVIVDGCPSDTSGIFALQVNPTPIIQPTSNSPVCEGTPLMLSVESTPGAMYEWTGPSGFSATVFNPIIQNADPALHAGTYKIRKKINGCWSDEISIDVIIKDKPTTPIATNFGPYCSDTEDVVVGVTPASATPGATYTWYETVTGTMLGTTSSLSFTIPGADLFGNDCVDFEVVATFDGCDSDVSIPTEVCINTIPVNQANAGADQEICETEVLSLGAAVPTVGTGSWTLASGPGTVIINNPDEPNTMVTGLIPGETYVFQWSLSNGACTDYSTDQVSVKMDILEDANAGENIIACNTDMVVLNATTPASQFGKWTQPAVQAGLNVVIVDPFDPQTAITGLLPGTSNEYFFTWTIDGGCGESSDIVKVSIVSENAFAGENFEDCGDGCTQLNADAPGIGGGLWTSLDGKAEIIDPSDPSTVVCNLSPGMNTFVWTILNGACGPTSIDTVHVNYKFVPIANDDQVTVSFASEVEINILSNDEYIENTFINILEEPLGGTIEVMADGTLKYAADITFVGQDLIVYELCLEGCECSTATVSLNVGSDANCEAPSIITPNNDGMNDSFVVPCLSNLAEYPNSRVSIFNQWGDEIFLSTPYRNDWEGTYDGEEVPVGTYFYVVDFGNGTEPISGFLIIQR